MHTYGTNHPQLKQYTHVTHMSHAKSRHKTRVASKYTSKVQPTRVKQNATHTLMCT